MAFLDLIFPTECAGCGASGALACRSCRAALSGRAVPAWPSPSPADLPPPWAVAAYADPCRAMLLAYKERGAVGLRGALAVPLAAAIGALCLSSEALLIVPVPSTPRAVRTRGDDVVLALTRAAAAIARRSGARVKVVRALHHRRTVVDSAGLSAAARAANLADAFVVRRKLHGLIDGETVILADDLITTGATLAEAARALSAAGATVIGAATVAATARRD